MRRMAHPHKLNQDGFIPMIIGLILLLIGGVFLAYLRVRGAR